MNNYAILETRVHEAVNRIQRLKEKNKQLSEKNKRLESQYQLVLEENASARKLIAQHNSLMVKQKKAKERIQHLWEHLSQVV